MELVELGSVCKIKTGKTPSTKVEEYFNGSVNWYNPSDLDKSKYLGKSKRTITKLALEENKAVVFEKDTLLMTCIGDIGKIGITSEICSSNQQLTGLIPNNNLNVDYLYYVIKKIKPYLNDIANSAVVSILNNKNLSIVKIPLPPLPTQKKIAAILDEADTLRQLNKNLITKYDALTQSLFLEMFGDPVANPMGWEKVRMDKIMKIVRGGSPRPIDKYLGGTYPWIKIGDATKGGDIYLESTKQYIIEEGLKKTRLLPKGSLIFANCGVSLGFARIINFEGCIHDGWLAFSEFDDKRINKVFLLKALNSITRFFRETAPDGTQPNLNIGIMSKFEIILPKIELQSKFEKSLFVIEQQKAQAQQSLQKSEDLFNSLLQKAFKGELVK